MGFGTVPPVAEGGDTQRAVNDADADAPGDGSAKCVVDEKFTALLRRLNDRSLVTDADEAAAAAAAARNALQGQFAACAGNTAGARHQRNEIAVAFLKSSPDLTILDVFDAFSRDSGAAAGSVCVPILVIVSRLLSCFRSPPSTSRSSSHMRSRFGHENGVDTTSNDDSVYAAKIDAIAIAMIQSARLRVYYSFLNSGTRAKANAVLLMLASVVRRGSRFAREVLNRFDWKLNALGRLAKPQPGTNDAGDDEAGATASGKSRRPTKSKLGKSTRYALQELAIALLRCRDDSVVRTVVSQEAPLQILMKHVSEDEDCANSYRLLATVGWVVFASESIPPRLQVTVFGDAVLSQLGTMCESLDTAQISNANKLDIFNTGATEASPLSAYDRSAACALRLLVQTCSTVGGTGVHRRGGAPDMGSTRTKKLMKLVVGLRPFSSRAHEHVLWKLCENNPMLALRALNNLKLTLEPSFSSRWIQSISLFSRAASWVHSYCNGLLCQKEDVAAPTIMELTSQLRLLLATVSRAAFNRGLLHSSPLIQYHAAQFIHAFVADVAVPILRCFQSVEDHCVGSRRPSCEGVSACSRDDAPDDDCRELDIVQVTSVLPDPQTVVSVLVAAVKAAKGDKASSTAASGTDEKSLSAAHFAATLLASRMLQLLTLYYEHFPDFMAMGTNFDPITMVISTVASRKRLAGRSRGDFPLLLIKGLFELQSSHAVFVERLQGQRSTIAPSVSVLTSLLSLACECRDESRWSAHAVYSVKAASMRACFQMLERCEAFGLGALTHSLITDNVWAWMTALTKFEYFPTDDDDDTRSLPRFLAEAIVSGGRSFNDEAKRLRSLLESLQPSVQSEVNFIDDVYQGKVVNVPFMAHVITRCFRVVQSNVMSDRDKSAIVLFVCCGLKLSLTAVSTTRALSMLISMVLMKVVDAEWPGASQGLTAVDDMLREGVGKHAARAFRRVLEQYGSRDSDSRGIASDSKRSSWSSVGETERYVFSMEPDMRQGDPIDGFCPYERSVLSTLEGINQGSIESNFQNLLQGTHKLDSTSKVPIFRVLHGKLQAALRSHDSGATTVCAVVQIMSALVEDAMHAPNRRAEMDTMASEVLADVDISSRVFSVNGETLQNSGSGVYSMTCLSIERLVIPLLRRRLDADPTLSGDDALRSKEYLAKACEYILRSIGHMNEGLRLAGVIDLVPHFSVVQLREVLIALASLVKADTGSAAVDHPSWRQLAIATLKSVLHCSFARLLSEESESTLGVWDGNVVALVSSVSVSILNNDPSGEGADVARRRVETETVAGLVYRVVAGPSFECTSASCVAADRLITGGCVHDADHLCSIDRINLCSSSAWSSFIKRTIRVRSRQVTTAGFVTNMRLAASLARASLSRWHECESALFEYVVDCQGPGWKQTDASVISIKPLQFHDCMRLLEALAAVFDVAVQFGAGRRALPAHSNAGSTMDKSLFIAVATLKCFCKYLGKKCSVKLSVGEQLAVRDTLNGALQLLENGRDNGGASATIMGMVKTFLVSSLNESNLMSAEDTQVYEIVTTNTLASIALRLSAGRRQATSVAAGKENAECCDKSPAAEVFGMLMQLTCRAVQRSSAVRTRLIESLRNPKEIAVVDAEVNSLIDTYRSILLAQRDTTGVLSAEDINSLRDLIDAVFRCHLDNANMMMGLTAVIDAFKQIETVAPSRGEQCDLVVTSSLTNLATNPGFRNLVLESYEKAEDLPLAVQRMALPMTSILDYWRVECNYTGQLSSPRQCMIFACRIIRDLLSIGGLAPTTGSRPETAGLGDRQRASLTHLLLCGYHATRSAVDREIYATVCTLEKVSPTTEGIGSVIAIGHLWGRAAQRAHDRITRGGGFDPSQIQSILAEGNIIDCKRAAIAVIDFPPDSSNAPGVVEKGPGGATSLSDLQGSHGYDPAFFLPFVVHALSVQGLLPSEVSSQGMLAMAIMSLCVTDEAIRRVGYSVLEYYVQKASSQYFREKTRILSLIDALQKTAGGACERLPTFLCIFCAEASVALHFPDSEMYSHIQKELEKESGLNRSVVPLYSKLMKSGASSHRRHRTWALKLLGAGARHAHPEDEAILRRGFTAEILMSAYHSSVFDGFTKRHILAAVSQIARLQFCSSDLSQFAGMAQWFTVNAISSMHEYPIDVIDEGLSQVVPGLIEMLRRLEGESKIHVGLACVKQLCNGVDRSQPERVLKPLMHYMHDILIEIAASKAACRHAWDKNCMDSLHSVWRLVKQCVGHATRRRIALDERLALDTVSLVLPDSLSDARYLARPGDEAYPSWCEASAWSAMAASRGWSAAAHALPGIEARSATVVFRDVLSNLSAFSRSGIPFRTETKGTVGRRDRLAILGARCLAAAVSQIYDGLPADTQQASADDCAHALLGILSTSESVLSGVHSEGEVAHQYICRLLSASAGTWRPIQGAGHESASGMLSACIVTMLRLVSSDAPLSSLDAVFEEAKLWISPGMSNGSRPQEGTRDGDCHVLSPPPIKRARRSPTHDDS